MHASVRTTKLAPFARAPPSRAPLVLSRRRSRAPCRARWGRRGRCRCRRRRAGSPARATPPRGKRRGRARARAPRRRRRRSRAGSRAPTAPRRRRRGGATRRRAAAATRTGQRRRCHRRAAARRRRRGAPGAARRARRRRRVDREGRLLHGVGALLGGGARAVLLAVRDVREPLAARLAAETLTAGGRVRRRAAVFACARRGGGTGVAMRAGVRARERPGVRVECCICARGAPEDARPLPLPARLLGAARAAVFSSCAISAGPRAHMSQRRLWFWFERDRVLWSSRSHVRREVAWYALGRVRSATPP